MQKEQKIYGIAKGVRKVLTGASRVSSCTEELMHCVKVTLSSYITFNTFK